MLDLTLLPSFLSFNSALRLMSLSPYYQWVQKPRWLLIASSKHRLGQWLLPIPSPCRSQLRTHGDVAQSVLVKMLLVFWQLDQHSASYTKPIGKTKVPEDSQGTLSDVTSDGVDLICLKKIKTLVLVAALDCKWWYVKKICSYHTTLSSFTPPLNWGAYLSSHSWNWPVQRVNSGIVAKIKVAALSI